jgi:polyisoprenoid-binding protein YceI
MSTSTVEVPGLVAGTWTIDPVHSEVGFSVRHLMVSKVRGTFTTFEGAITVAENSLDSKVEATIDASTVVTGDENRDAHLRSQDFFDIEKHPKITFVSTKVQPHGSDYVVTGDLTIHGVTRSVDLDLEFNGVSPDPWGGQRAGFSASTEISRGDYGIEFNMAVDGGGVVVGDKVKIIIEIEAILQKDETPAPA